ncbi:cyclic nucleotide-binding domain-containing protein [Candidatus Peregrinibacteria bacterium]|jgi:CRP/FNR family transcriptional regulator, cyclic AMP receptor protein|nr:cyclic nucleotide-binding domain-containing protein [Candidatus Peregrinibacteria bacterium]MBT7483285.1 cyclic nucleotide-binding domain-containing protein [Candidatus Peregrinibacteria bacterium]MBT7703132.1 cyclic nucleotide-binding domain-containing protein [Candidatus Peregrinibacteria bacterium]
MENTTILPILKKIPLFAELTEEDHAEIIKNITLNYFPVDYTLFEEGAPGDKLYIIKTGMVKIFHPSNPDEAVAMLSPNEFFGEMALFEDTPRTASAMTTEESEVFLLEKSDFYKLVLKNKSIAGKLSEEFLNRIQSNKE